MNKGPVRVFLTTSLLSIFLAMSMNKMVYGQTTDILVKEESGKWVQYSYNDLKESLMGDKKLFSDFKAKKVMAYKDDKKNYVDFEYLKNIYMNTDRKSFNLNATTENAPLETILKLTNSIVKRVQGPDGSLLDGETISPTSEPIESGGLKVEDIY